MSTNEFDLDAFGVFTPDDGGRSAAQEADQAPRVVRAEAAIPEHLQNETDGPDTSGDVLMDAVKKSMIKQFGSWDKVPAPLKAMFGLGPADQELRPRTQTEKELSEMHKSGAFVEGRNAEGKWVSEVYTALQEKYGETKIHGEGCGCGDPLNYVTGALLDLYEVDGNFRDMMDEIGSQGPNARIAKEFIEFLKMCGRRMSNSLREVGTEERKIRWYVRDLFSLKLNEGVEKDW